MDELYRRVILKPEGATPQQCAQLRELLTAAVRLQNDLAGKSAHILRFIGEVQETAEAFFIEHESAEPVPLEPLFDPALPGATVEELFEATGAILDAIRAAHQVRQPRPATHGGLCPGVLLKAPGGILKVTDFDFARSLQAVFGLDAYLCLAVGPRLAGGPIPESASGVWEVVPPEVIDRDDRICAFIDPSKHSSQRYEGFESRSDVVAAGFLLFLMAEHRHPYFYGDPQAHRSVDMATQIVLPSPFRRADLREPEDPRLQTWCQMVRRMVSLDWEKRPSAEEALKATGVTPIDLKGIAVRQIEELKKEAVEHGLDDLMWWAQAIEKAEQLAETEGLPAERLREVQAVQLLGTAIGLMGGLDWERSEEPLARLLALPGVPASFVEKAKSIGVLRERCLAARDRLDNLEKEMADIESLPLGERSRRLDELEKAIETLVGVNLLPLLDERLRPMPGGLSVRRALLRQQLDKVRAEAGEWLAQADAALAGENWEQLAGLMAAPPPATEFDEGIAAQVAEYRRQFNEHEEQERQRQQRRADLERRVSEARKLIAEEKAAEARERLGGVESQREFPDLADAGRQLLDQLVELEKRLEALRRVRARVDELLSAARSHLEARSLADLTEAEQLLEQALQTDGRSDEQTRQARGLQQQVAKVRQEIVEAWRRQKEKAQGELKKAQSQLAKHRYRDAEAAAAQLVGFDDAEIVSAAKTIIETVSRKRAEAVAEIEKQLADAREWLAGAEFEAARQCVEGVSGHDLAGAEHLAAAKALAGEIESARRAAEQDRQKAKAELEQSREALDRGDFLAARRLAGQVLTSRFGEPGVKQGAQALLDATAPLAEADEYIASKDYPAAIRVLDNLLADGATPSGSLESAAAALRERAVQERAQAEVAYLVEHLTRRAELEEKSGFVRSVPVEQTITRKIPEWAGQSLRSFETFMGDWVGDHVAEGPEARSTLLAPQDRFGDKYEIVRHIGRGGMGEVYLARDVMLDRLVALKLAPSVGDLKDLAEHLQIEAKAIARLDYPKHILRINSFGTTEGRYYFDTDYKEAPNLADYARENGPLSHRRIAEIVIPIAQALDYAHRKGIYHRDIKPTNILIGRSPDEGPWLIDFGLAKISSICHQRARQGLCGTPGYMAPEVIRSMGEGVDDRAADIFSLGCVLYELLTGALPYQSPRSGSVPPKSSSSVTHPPRLGASSKGGPTQSLPGHRPGVARLLLNTLQAKPLVWDEKIPEPLREVCRKALAPDPKARFASASEMSEALEAFLHDLDRRDVEEGLARARAAFESRRQNEPGEPADLDEVHKQAQALSARATGKLGDEVKRLLAEVEATRGRIQEQIEQGRAQIELAKVHLAESKWALAIEAATAAAEVGYEPGLKDEADPIIEEAQRRRRQQRGRTMKWVGVAAGLALVVGGAGVWWMTRPPATSATKAPDAGTGTGTGAGAGTGGGRPAPGSLVVASPGPWTPTGPEGGPFSPTSQAFELTNPGGSRLAWKVEVPAADKWFQVSRLEGVLDPGGRETLSISLTQEAGRLAPGKYESAITVVDAERKKSERLAVTLSVSRMAAPPGALVVASTEPWTITGRQGGPFTPATHTYAISNTGGSKLSWTADAPATDRWLAVSRSKGELAAGGKDTLTVALVNEEAAKLSPNTYESAVALVDVEGKKTIELPVTLTIGAMPPPPPPGELVVSPAGEWNVPFPDGKPPADGFKITLKNTGGSPVEWSATSTKSWLVLRPDKGPPIPPGQTQEIIATFTDQARVLPPAERSAAITITQNGKPVEPPHTLKLTIPEPGALAVRPKDAWRTVFRNGAFTPSSFTATLENAGELPVKWTAQSSRQWITLSKPGGTLAKGAEEVVVTLKAPPGGLTAEQLSPVVSFRQEGRPDAQDLRLTIQRAGVVRVTAAEAWESELKGGQFTPPAFTATLENEGDLPAKWAVESSAAWLKASPADRGTLEKAGDKATVTFTLDAAAAAAGSVKNGDEVTVSFKQDGTIVGKPTTLRLRVPMPGKLELVAEGEWQAEIRNGAAAPATFTAKVRNTGGSPVSWTAQVEADKPWLEVTAPKGEAMTEPGQATDFTLAFNTQVNGLKAGDYEARVRFLDAANKSELLSRMVKLKVPAASGESLWLARRAEIEGVFKGLPADSGPLDPRQAFDLLAAIASVKYRPADPNASPSMKTKADLAAWVGQLHKGLGDRASGLGGSIKVKPARCIEYFWGAENVHAICLYADAAGGLQAARYYRLTGGARGADDLLAQAKAGQGSLGDVLIRPILMDPAADKPPFFPPGNQDSFGVAIAPDGPLVFMGLERMPFAPVDVANTTVLEVIPQQPTQPRPLVGPIQRLIDLTQKPQGAAGPDGNTSKHTAIWLLPTLGGTIKEAGGGLAATYERMYKDAWAASRPGGAALAVTSLSGRLGGGACLHGADTPSTAVRSALTGRITRDLPLSVNTAPRFDVGFFSPRMILDDSNDKPILLADPVE